jgi:hypothetical protein
MTITAARCVLVSSRWVHAFILTCDDKLAVWFKRRVRGGRGRGPGVCCYYPGSNRNFFNLAITWGDPGKFVHRFLYRRLGYRIINPPCPAAGCGVTTACCPAALPTTLHAACNLGAGTVALTYDGSKYWAGTAHPSCGDTVLLRLHCPAGSTDCTGLVMESSCNGGSTWSPVLQLLEPPCSCSPLSVSFGTTLSALSGCTGCGGQSLTATVTT